MERKMSMDAGFGGGIADDTDGLARTFARSRVGLGALAANRQATEVADATVAFNTLETF